jgi:hypothetical protein
VFCVDAKAINDRQFLQSRAVGNLPSKKSKGLPLLMLTAGPGPVENDCRWTNVRWDHNVKPVLEAPWAIQISERSQEKSMAPDCLAKSSQAPATAAVATAAVAAAAIVVQ